MFQIAYSVTNVAHIQTAGVYKTGDGIKVRKMAAGLEQSAEK